MEEYYNKNYMEYEIFANSDFSHKKVWNVHHDDNFDLVYVFLGKIKQIKGKSLVQFETVIKQR